MHSPGAPEVAARAHGVPAEISMGAPCARAHQQLLCPHALNAAMQAALHCALRAHRLVRRHCGALRPGQGVGGPAAPRRPPSQRTCIAAPQRYLQKNSSCRPCGSGVMRSIPPAWLTSTSAHVQARVTTVTESGHSKIRPQALIARSVVMHRAPGVVLDAQIRVARNE